jgi:hypothetical protein
MAPLVARELAAHRGKLGLEPVDRLGDQVRCGVVPSALAQLAQDHVEPLCTVDRQGPTDSAGDMCTVSSHGASIRSTTAAG